MSAVQQGQGELLCAALPEPLATAWAAVDGLDAALVAAHAAAQPASLRAPTLARHVASLAQRIADGTIVGVLDVTAIAALDHTAIALADACVDGDADAIAWFHRHHGRDIEHAISRVSVPPAMIDDIRQIVLAKLLPPGRKLARYAGRGALSNWVRAVTVRETISVLRSGIDAAEEMPDAIEVAASLDLELSFIRHAQRERLRTALRAAFDALDPEDRAVLRYRFLDGLTLDQLAVVLGIHRATAARWLARIRESLLRATRRRLSDELGLDRTEFDELVALVRSNLEITIGGLLRA